MGIGEESLPLTLRLKPVKPILFFQFRGLREDFVTLMILSPATKKGPAVDAGPSQLGGRLERLGQPRCEPRPNSG